MDVKERGDSKLSEPLQTPKVISSSEDRAGMIEVQPALSNEDSVNEAFCGIRIGQDSNLAVKDIRLRLNSDGGSIVPANRQLIVAAPKCLRPSTTDGNHKQRLPRVFWEDMDKNKSSDDVNSLPYIPSTVNDSFKKPHALSTGTSQGPPGSPPIISVKSAVDIHDTTSSSSSLKPPSIQVSGTSNSSNQKSTEKKQSKKPQVVPPLPLVRFNSSGDFKAVVDDLYGKKEKKPIRLTKWINVRRLAQVTPREVRTGTGTGPPKMTLGQREAKTLKLKAASNHGWAVIRRYVERQRLLKFTSGASMNWNVLKHHLSHMSDIENTRKDLYQRYGVIPTLQSDGTYRTANVMRPKNSTLKIMAFKSVKPEKNISAFPKIHTFRQKTL